MGKYTPGPWFVERRREPWGDRVSRVIAEGKSIRWPICRFDAQPPCPYREANAQLIAALPELAEALVRIVKAFDNPDDEWLRVDAERELETAIAIGRFSLRKAGIEGVE